MKKRILNGKVQWPKGKFVAVLSPTAKNLIQRLLAKSPDQRLTGEAVMQHEWFKGIDWGKLERREVRNRPSSSSMHIVWFRLHICASGSDHHFAQISSIHPLIKQLAIRIALSMSE